MNLKNVVMGMREVTEQIGEPLSDNQFMTLSGYLGGAVQINQSDLDHQKALNTVLEEECNELAKELLRVRDVCLSECGVGVVNEIVLAKYYVS